MEVMEVHRHVVYDPVMKEEDFERGNQDFWDGLKQKICEELNYEEIQRLCFLLQDKSRGFVPDKGMGHLFQTLENEMPIDDVLSLFQHVFSIMDTYPEYENRSFGQLIQNYMNTRKHFSCSNIVGRGKEIDVILERLDNSRGIWIHGAGGIGKTSLANEVCLRLHYQGKNIKNVNLKHVRTSEDFVRCILSSFESYPDHSELKSLKQELLYDLKHISHDTYILLDNIEEVYRSSKEEVLVILHNVLDALERTPVKWIVTSRLPLETELDITALELQPLQRDHAEKLLKQSCRQDTLSEKRHQMLLDIAGGIPLALRVLASAFTFYESLKNITDDQIWACLNQELQSSTHVQNCIQFSYRLLTEKEQNQLRMLAVVDTSHFDVEIVKTVIRLEECEALLLMKNLTKLHLVQDISRKQFEGISKMPNSLLYCIHPSIINFLSNQEFTESIAQAQNKLCQYIIQKLGPYIANCDENYMTALKQVSKSRSLLKVMFNILQARQLDIEDFFEQDTNRYLRRIQEMLQMTPSEKEKLYTNVIENMRAKNIPCFFWELEQVRMFVDCHRFSDAETTLCSLEERLQNNLADDEFDTYIKGRFWYEKGRYLRCKKDKQLNEAIDCFKRSLALLENTEYIVDASMALNAIGNAYFNQDDYDNALKYHKEAAKILKEFVSNTVHPDLAIYEFNVGTIYHAKACQDFEVNQGLTETARHNFEQALKTFNNSITKDEQMKLCRSLQFAIKLAQRAQVLHFLDKDKDAINDMKRSVEVKVDMFNEHDRNVTLAYFKCGKTFLSWRQSRKYGSAIAKELLKEAVLCFRKAENEMRESGEACLVGEDKSCFIRLYRQIAREMEKREAKLINDFCERFESRVTYVSSSSSSSLSSDEEITPKSESHMSSDLDEGVSIEDDANYNETIAVCGIPSAQSQKQDALQFQEEIFEKINSQLSERESKKRSHSDSESD